MTEVKPFKPHWKMPLWNAVEYLDMYCHVKKWRVPYCCLMFDVVNGWSYEDPGFPRNPITRAICWILKP